MTQTVRYAYVKSNSANGHPGGAWGMKRSKQRAEQEHQRGDGDLDLYGSQRVPADSHQPRGRMLKAVARAHAQERRDGHELDE